MELFAWIQVLYSHQSSRCELVEQHDTGRASLAVAVGALSATEALHDVDEASVVLHASLGASSLLSFSSPAPRPEVGKIIACKMLERQN